MRHSTGVLRPVHSGGARQDSLHCRVFSEHACAARVGVDGLRLRQTTTHLFKFCSNWPMCSNVFVRKQIN
jgi:hypothetical protein